MKVAVVIDDNEIVGQLWPQTLTRAGLRTVPAIKLGTSSLKQFPKTMRASWRSESIRRCKQQFILYCSNPRMYAENTIKIMSKAPRMTRNFNGLFVTNPFCGNIHDRTDKANRFMAHCSFGSKDGPCCFKFTLKRDVTSMTTYELVHLMFCSFYNDMLVNFKETSRNTQNLNNCETLRFIYFALMFICDYLVSRKNVKALDLLTNESKKIVYPSFVNNAFFDTINENKTTFVICDNENEYSKQLSILSFCIVKNVM